MEAVGSRVVDINVDLSHGLKMEGVLFCCGESERDRR